MSCSRTQVPLPGIEPTFWFSDNTRTWVRCTRPLGHDTPPFWLFTNLIISSSSQNSWYLYSYLIAFCSVPGPGPDSAFCIFFFRSLLQYVYVCSLFFLLHFAFEKEPARFERPLTVTCILHLCYRSFRLVSSLQSANSVFIKLVMLYLRWRCWWDKNKHCTYTVLIYYTIKWLPSNGLELLP